MVGQHHRLNGREFEQALGIGDGQGNLAYCSPWGCKELDTTEQLNWPPKYIQNQPLLTTSSTITFSQIWGTYYLDNSSSFLNDFSTSLTTLQYLIFPKSFPLNYLLFFSTLFIPSIISYINFIIFLETVFTQTM